jgi:RNA polymerase sigma-70 factor (sigma-E family)
MAAGDETVDSFDAVFARHHEHMCRLAHLLVGSRAVGEELVQEAFLTLHQRFDTIHNPVGFVRTAVVNRARSWHRRANLERNHHRVGRADVWIDPVVDETWRLLRELPQRQRSVLVLRYYADLADDDIAQILGCRPATVRSIAHRALGALRKEIS